ncbi:MAG: hypothetical protein JJU40_03460 [Rhodobacteraceae bacterium]|nr:hypothetical protein [Paracoccaceae bacterium]
MKFRSFILVGAVAGLGVAGMTAAFASGDPVVDTGEIEVRAEIAPFIELTILDSALDWRAPTFERADNDLANNTDDGARARFSVEANTNYALTVTTVDGCWNASNLLNAPEASFRQVRFKHETNGDWIGGTLFLDRHPGSRGLSYSWNNDGADCRIATGTYPAENHIWGLGAAFRPRLVGNADNPGGIAGQLPAPGVYSATARITAATQ